MKHMKKSVVLLFALVLTFSLVLAGCGNKTDNSGNNGKNNTNTGTTDTGSSSNTNTAADDSKSPTLAPYELVVVYPSPPQADEKAVEAKINEYLKDKINATVDLRPIDWGPWNDQRNLMIGSKEKVDIYFTASWTLYPVHVSQGAFLPLNDLLDKYGQGIKDTLPAAFLDGSKIDGKNYGIPTNKELAAQGGIIYRTDIAEKLGLDMSNVKTLADLEPIFAKVKASGTTPIFMKEGESFATHYFSNLDYLGVTDIDGVILKDGTDSNVHSKLDEPRYLDILKTTRDFFKKGYINSDAATTQTSPTDALKSGQYFAIPAPLKPGKDKETEPAASLVGKLKQIEMNKATVTTGETTGAMLAISTTSKDPDRAMMFINLLHTDKYLVNLLNFGIEGTHFTRNGEIISGTDKTGDYAPGIAWEFGNQFNNYVWDNEAPDKWEQFKKFNDGAINSPALGFTFNPDPIKAEAASLLNVKKQYDAALETGSVDPDKVIPEYRDAMKAAGLDKAIKEKQDQLNKFLGK